MEGDESVALVFGREIVTGVEGDAEWGGMRLEQDVGDGHPSGEIRSRTLMARILVVADVVPWPAIEGVLLDLRRIFERGVVAELVAFVDGAPQALGRRLQGDAGAIPQPGRKNAL